MSDDFRKKLEDQRSALQREKQEKEDREKEQARRHQEELKARRQKGREILDQSIRPTLREYIEYLKSKSIEANFVAANTRRTDGEDHIATCIQIVGTRNRPGGFLIYTFNEMSNNFLVELSMDDQGGKTKKYELSIDKDIKEEVQQQLLSIDTKLV